MRLFVIALLASVSQPAFAQTMKMPDGQTMTMPAKPSVPKSKTPKPAAAKPAMAKKPLASQVKPKPMPKPAPVAKKHTGAAPQGSGIDHSAMDHSAMDHGEMDDGQTVSSDEASTSAQGMDISGNRMEGMDHGNMEMSAGQMSGMDHDNMEMSGGDMDGMDMAMPMADAPPPPEAGSGPANAADAIYGAEAMQASREQLANENGGLMLYWVMADRAEYRIRDGKNGYLWDAQGYYGGDIDKLWLKTEGEGSFGSKIESAEFQALWSHAIGPFFDFQTGVRQDFAPRDRTYAVAGVQGLVPYVFEIDSAAFLSDKGDLTARFEGEYDQRITQKLILQPRLEVNLSAQDIPELGIGAGIDTIEMGLRLRYEFVREFAPYIGIAQEWKLGQSAAYARADGENPSVTNFVLGIRFWF